MSVRIAATALCSAFCSIAFAQQPAPIERVRMTDSQLSCAQLFNESGDMDKAITAAKEAESSGNTTSTAGTAGNVAAEVAGRTGLFGQIGGLAGALFGQSAAQTAAGAARQSGQQTAAQAQERARQATARKEHLATLFIARGCKADDLAHNPPMNEQAAAAMQTALQASQPAAAKPIDPAELQKLFAPAAITALPDADPDKHFKGQMGGTFGKNVTEVMPNSRRVAVPGFRVVFITENTATATVRSSYFLGRDSSGASSTLNLKLAGVDAATMQAITDKAYADFVQQLKFAGREVVPLEELKEFISGLEVSGGPGKPHSVSDSGQTGVVFSPTGIPLWFTNWDGKWGDKGPFQQTNIRRVAEYSAKHNAIFIAPLIVVNFAHMSSSGNRSGIYAREAETGAELGMHVGAFSSNWTRSAETRMGLVMNGDDGALQMQAPILSDSKFGSMKEVAQADNKDIKASFDILGKSLGLLNAGGPARNKSENVAETTGPAYAAAAIDVLGRATGTFAKWFQKYPAK